jgi:hypothetical protein
MRRLGRNEEGRAVLADVIKQMRRAPGFAQKAQRVWIAMAEKGFRDRSRSGREKSRFSSGNRADKRAEVGHAGRQ